MKQLALVIAAIVGMVIAPAASAQGVTKSSRSLAWTPLPLVNAIQSDPSEPVMVARPGLVCLRGKLQRDAAWSAFTDNTTAATLPPGLRPASASYVITSGHNGGANVAVYLKVQTDGALVVVTAAGALLVSLDGICFAGQ